MDVQFQSIQKYLQVAGAVGVIPSDTIYGLMARATDKEAVSRLYVLKHREHKPGTLIAANIEQLVTLGIPRRYLTPMERFWPGPISVVIPCGPELAYLHQGIGSLAIRVPSDDRTHALLERTGPLLTSSANQPGAPVATTVQEAKMYFKGQVDFYVDGGDMSDRKPSTIVRVVDDAVEVLREGAVYIDETGEVKHDI